MKAAEKYRRVFGSISHLKDEIPWTTGLSNMVEFLVWEPQRILGISKKQYVRQIIEWAAHPEMQGKTLQDIEDEVSNKLQSQMDKNEQLNTYSTQTTGICNAREAVRRVKFFSEDYLNKEFDIFLSLCSDSYLNTFYEKFITFNKGGSWSIHGNSGIFEFSTELKAMQMDNLAYNHDANVLVANELKLNGQKNPDQVLKYCLMYKHLVQYGFINHDAKFLLLFIDGKNHQYDKDKLIVEELRKCELNGQSHLATDEVLEVIKHIHIVGTTWQKFSAFNDGYLAQNELCQVEQKLLQGFNKSLQSKAFMHPSG